MAAFSRIAIVNRGEPARRLIHAARELGAERGSPMRTVALHTEEERRATFVREADEAVVLRRTAGNPYLDHAELERALRASGADAAWVGWGFVAEDPLFAELCDRLGITFVGPQASVMRALGDKVQAKLLAERVGLPVAAWSGGPVGDVAEALDHAGRIGYPLVIKASAGGGGRGIRVVAQESELATAFERARDEALKSFGDPQVFMERLVTGARHIEVQVIADHHGGAWAVGVRDCSIQRRKQKILEESASPVLTPQEAADVRQAALSLVHASGYRNAGTVEFLFQPGDRTFAFLEVNTRLQVEHPVTELATGVDLVKLQLLVAAGGSLDDEPPAEIGHAIEARLNAEDVTRGFAPAPGTVDVLALPTGPGIRVDTGVAQGDAIPPEYDSMIAKVLAWGRDREEARARLRRALSEAIIVIDGGATNRSLLLDLLDRAEFVSGEADTEWVDRLAADGDLLGDHGAGCALLTAAIESYDAEEAVERQAFYAAARRGRPEASHAVGRTIEMRHRGHAYAVDVAQIGPRLYAATLDGVRVDVEVERLGRFVLRMRLGGDTHRVVVANGPDYLIEVDGVAHRVSRDEGGLVRAPGPSLVVSVAVAPGDEVVAGAPVIVLESMKMETTVTAPFDGDVVEVLVPGNVQVAAGAPLVRIQQRGGATTADAGGDRVRLAPDPDATGGSPQSLAPIAAIRRLLLGFDVGDDEVRGIVADLAGPRPADADEDTALLHAEIDVLTVFTDIAELLRDRPAHDDPDPAEETQHSPREHFHAYLRSLDADREGVPDALRAGIVRALAHYGVQGLDRTPELADAAYRLFLAQERAPSSRSAITALLERLLRSVRTLPSGLADDLQATLDRLIPATQLRHPAVAEIARSVRYRHIDAPRVAAERERLYAETRAQLASLDAAPDAPDRDERIAVLSTSREPLMQILRERVAGGISADEPMLEVITRRYYRVVGGLEDVQRVARDGRPFLTAFYERLGRRVRLVTTIAQPATLRQSIATVGELVGSGDGAEGGAVDVYLAWNDLPGDLDAVAATIGEALAEVGLPPRVGRVAVTIPDGPAGSARHFTFRRADGGFREDEVARGLHPMIARRLQIGRLENFDLSRLPSVEDTYLFRCVARDNPADERLAVFAEARELTPVRNAAGALVALPEVERALAGCLEGVRRAQHGVPAAKRLTANLVCIHVWAPIRGPIPEIIPVARRLAPMTAGLGVEQVVLFVRRAPDAGEPGPEMDLSFSYDAVAGITVDLSRADTAPIAPFDEYRQRVLAARRRGAAYPYELVRLLAGPEGTFTELDLDDDGRLVEVDRAPGMNRAGIVAGLVRTPTPVHPEGMVRIALLGDPTRSLGSVSEPECARVMAAIDLADELGVPVEWLALSSGAKISRDSGTENMDWVARVLRRIIEFTQAGGEINVIVAGINVGAQPYWNAEATMLMHTKGILVMTPDSAMVLTGKQALEYSGGVAAEDNFGIGGYDRIMGPNGQAQYWAPHLAGACGLLFAHYAHTYVQPGERFPRTSRTSDPDDRDVCAYPHVVAGSDFRTVGDIFSPLTNPERKKPFDIRTLMRAVADQDRPPLERWPAMADAETAVAFDAHLGGQPIALLGIESRPIPRHGFLPADGPDQWTAGTLFPLSSKKAARAINAASGNRPLVVLANLSGFDGSPESLRKWQLENGAEIGRAVVNFEGPIIFCVVSRYHGGAFVVFSGVLNDAMQVFAVEGSYASVIGGAPAAAVVFAGDVRDRTNADPRVAELQARLAEAGDGERAVLRDELAEVTAAVRSEKLGEVAAEFDAIHSVERAREVGSVHEIIPAATLRPRLIAAVREGIARFTAED